MATIEFYALDALGGKLTPVKDAEPCVIPGFEGYKFFTHKGINFWQRPYYVVSHECGLTVCPDCSRSRSTAVKKATAHLIKKGEDRLRDAVKKGTDRRNRARL